MVEQLRRENQRALRQLDEVIFSKQGMEATKNYQLDAVSREQGRIRAELARIRQTTATTWGVLPARKGEQREDDTQHRHAEKFTSSIKLHPYKESKRQKAKKQKLNRMKAEENQKTAGHLKQFNDKFPGNSPAFTTNSFYQNGSEAHSLVQDEGVSKVRSFVSDNVSHRQRELSIGDMSVTEAKDLVNRRLLATELSMNGDQAPPESPRHPHALAPIDEKRILPAPKPEEVFNAPREPERDATHSNLDVGDSGESKTKTVQSSVKQKTPAVKKDMKAKQKMKEKDAEPEDGVLKFDASKYNPDGSIRMMHRLPDFGESLTQALRARYVRNNFKSWYERELTVGQIFSDDQRYEPGDVKLYTVTASNIPFNVNTEKR